MWVSSAKIPVDLLTLDISMSKSNAISSPRTILATALALWCIGPYKNKVEQALLFKTTSTNSECF